MIKANELRIGNLLQGEPLSIPRLNMYHDGVTAITGYGISLIESESITSLNAIPLTDDWLLRFGFVNSQADEDDNWNEGFWSKAYDRSLPGVAIGYILQDKVYECEINAELIIQIKHVHQLQNLYFALTGKELKIARGTATVGPFTSH